MPLPTDLGGSSGGRTPPLAIRPFADPNFDIFGIILRYSLYFFLKAPSAPKHTNFERERAPKKRKFFGQHFLLMPKNPFFVFCRKLGQTRSL